MTYYDQNEKPGHPKPSPKPKPEQKPVPERKGVPLPNRPIRPTNPPKK